MNVFETNIIDSNAIDNTEGSKILLMDDLVEYFAPLFYEDLRKKQGQLERNKLDVEKLKNSISLYRIKLGSINSSIEIESTKNQILKEIEFLNNVDVLYGKNRMVVQNIILGLDNQKLAALKKSLVLLQKISSDKQKKRSNA